MSHWEGINEFVAVAEVDSFTLAAKRLGTSVAHVSRQVSALELRLGAKLLQRTTRKVSVTEEGRIYYSHCRQILDGLDDAERAITNLQSKPTGKLRLTAPVAYGEQYIAPLVNEFALTHKNLDVDLWLTNQQLDPIEDHFDLAIRLGVLEDSRLVAKKLGSRIQYVCASPEYTQCFGQPQDLSDLANHNCLLGTLDYWRFEQSGKSKNVRVRGNLRCNSGTVLLDAALKGLGWVQLPDYYVKPFIERGELVTALDAYRQKTEGIWALYPPNRRLSPKVRMLIGFLVARL